MYNTTNGTVHCDGLIFPVKINKNGENVTDNNQHVSYQIPQSFGKHELFGAPVTEEKEMSVSIVYHYGDQVILGCDSRIIDPKSSIPNDKGIRYYVDRSRSVAAVFSGNVFIRNDKAEKINVVDMIKDFIQRTDGIYEDGLFGVLSSLYKDYIFTDCIINLYFGKGRCLVRFVNGKIDTQPLGSNAYLDSNEEIDAKIIIDGSPILQSWNIGQSLTKNINFEDTIDSEAFIRKIFLTIRDIHEDIRKHLDHNFISPVGGDIHVIRFDNYGRILVDGKPD